MRFDKTLVWLKPRFLGDAVMATPLMRAVADRSGETTVLVSPHVREMLAAEAHLITLDAGPTKGIRAVWKEARRLRKRRFDAVFLVNRSFRSAAIARLAGIPVRIGHTTEGRSALLTHKVLYELDKLESHCYGDLGRVVGIPSDDDSTSLTVNAAEISRGRDLAGEGAVGIQPGATADRKLVPTPVLMDTIRHLRGMGMVVVILGAESERATSQPIIQEFGAQVVDLVGSCTLRETMGVLKNLRLLVGGDTGLIHIATALATPSLAVFGPTPIKKWGYEKPTARSLQAPNGELSLVQAKDVQRLVDLLLKSA